MLMSWIWTGFLAVSVLCALLQGRGAALAGAVAEGAQAGAAVCLSLAGSVCLWSGVGKLMEKTGVTRYLSQAVRPFLRRIFPGTGKDPVLEQLLSANICANFLGLGNAATPLGIRAARRLVDPASPQTANDALCRLVVLNTASIQLIPANVAAVRASAGCLTPFDILPAVWLTSLCAASVGLACAFFLGKVWKT